MGGDQKEIKYNTGLILKEKCLAITPYLFIPVLLL